MPKQRTISSRQLDLLLQLMEQNRDLANGRLAAGPLAHQQVHTFWGKVALRLNSCADGATKEPNAWKKYWLEMRYRTKKRASEVRVSIQGTGGGPSARALTQMEERILHIMGTIAYQGLPEVQIPLQLPSSSAQDRPAQDRPAQDRPVQDLPAQDRPVQDLPAQDRPVQDRPARDRPVQAPQRPPLPSPPQVPSPIQIEELPPSPSGRSPPPPRIEQEGIQEPRNRRRIRRPARNQALDTEPPAWARNYEERRLALEEANAATLVRIASAIERAMEYFISRSRDT